MRRAITKTGIRLTRTNQILKPENNQAKNAPIGIVTIPDKIPSATNR